MTAILPDLNHLSRKDFHYVYEPADDTFLLCDALQNEIEFFCKLKPRIIMEIGSGSGCVISFLSSMLKSASIGHVAFATDINEKANTCTVATAMQNKLKVDVVRCDFAAPFSGLNRSIDIFVFNPPYVPTPPEEVGGHGIEASWAGGENGRVVIDRFLPILKDNLSDFGVCYLVLVEENNPKEIAKILLTRYDLQMDIILKRKAANELLFIAKIYRKTFMS